MEAIDMIQNILVCLKCGKEVVIDHTKSQITYSVCGECSKDEPHKSFTNLRVSHGDVSSTVKASNENQFSSG